MSKAIIVNKNKSAVFFTNKGKIETERIVEREGWQCKLRKWPRRLIHGDVVIKLLNMSHLLKGSAYRCTLSETANNFPFMYSQKKV